MKHDEIWRALDTLAAENGLSASGLAKRAGLDPTTFNPSKRRMQDGRARWPSTESLAKVLEATGASLEAFTALVTGARALTSGAQARNVGRWIPLIGLAQAGNDGYFDDGGYPVGGGMGRGEPARDRRSECLCAGDQRRLDGAGISGRGYGDRISGCANPPRR